MTTLKKHELKSGLKIKNNANPEWGIFVISTEYEKGIWELGRPDGTPIGTLLFEEEAELWNKI